MSEITQAQLDDLREKAAAVVRDTNEKIHKANLKIEELRALRVAIEKEQKALAVAKANLEIERKHVRYAQLRIYKLVDEQHLDQSIKKLVEQAGEVPSGV